MTQTTALLMTEQIVVHVGLVGHIDHGKTALAAVLSEGVFTAGLDKHPQARERGITIDLGFTMFRLDKYVVTLVDAPGHADLIRSVVAGASIIDAAILTVAADEGPKVQTGEHLIVLNSVGIDSLVVAITKTDLTDEERINRVEAQTRFIVDDLDFAHVEYVRVSAKKRKGIGELRAALLRVLTPRPRNTGGPFLMPIDHAFSVKGHGTVVTGTVLRGEVSVGDETQLMPQSSTARVRSIQSFGVSRERAGAGDRVGINVPELDSRHIVRGDYLCEPGTLSAASKFAIHFRKNRFYRYRVGTGMTVSAHFGMTAVTAKVYPVIIQNGKMILTDGGLGDEFDMVLVSQKPVVAEVGMRVLVIRTDLGPTEMRIVGAGDITSVLQEAMVYRKRERIGRVSRVREHDVLVEGLASRRERAVRLTGTIVKTAEGVQGRLGDPFGTRGVICATFSEPVTVGDTVILERLVEEEL